MSRAGGCVTRRARAAAIVAVLLSASPRCVTARPLSDLLLEAAPNIVAAPFVDELQRTISRGTDFPATATTPGFVYRYNPEVGVYERSSASLGPAFLERADTVGKGRFDVGLSYLFAHFNEIDGEDLDGFSEGVLFENLGVLDAATVTFDEFDLTTNAFYFSSTYGVTDRWDVNVLVPVFYTGLDVQQTAQTLAFGTLPPTAGDDTALGPGDLQLRTKYLFLESGQLKMAAGLGLRIPTGNEEDFQGIGDYTVTPSVVVSWVPGPVDLHASLGVETDASDLQQSRATYGAGISLGVIERLTANLDVIGNSQFTDDEISTFVAASPAAVGVGAGVLGPNVRLKPRAGGTEVITTLDRLDVVDVAVGLKANVVGSAVVFGSAIFPLTSQGVRATVIPAGGIEVSF
jgi:hypothetical protein